MPTEIDNRVVDTSKASGSEFPFNIDIQSGNSVGLGTCHELKNAISAANEVPPPPGLAQSTIGNGTRSSSATAYLDPVLNRTNLHVLIKNTVTRLIQSGESNGTLEFKKVEFAASQSCEYLVYASALSYELIICI